MNELRETLKTLRKLRQSYVRMDPVIGAEMSCVPLSDVVKHYSCEEAVKRLMAKGARNELEEKALDLITQLSGEAGVKAENFGLTGSLLLGIHHSHSDIDLIVYGGENFWKTLEAVEALGYRGKAEAEPFLEKYPIGREDAEKLASRVRHKGVYRGTLFSIHGVRSLEEIEEKYGDRIYQRVGLARARFEILDERESGFTPAVYLVEGEAETKDGGHYPVERLTCYDLSFMALFKKGDRVEAYGKLEKVRDRRAKRSYYSLLIGSVEAAGREYVKLI